MRAKVARSDAEGPLDGGLAATSAEQLRDGPVACRPLQGKDAGEQTAITMRKIEAGLKSAGARMADLMRLTIYVTDIRDMAGVTKALAKALKGSVVTSTLVAVTALAVPGLLVEIDAIVKR